MMPRLNSDEHAVRLALYEANHSDAEMGERLGVSRQTIGRWRRRLNLPANKDRSWWSRSVGAQKRLGRSIQVSISAGANWRGACAKQSLTAQEGCELFRRLDLTLPEAAQMEMT